MAFFCVGEDQMDGPLLPALPDGFGRAADKLADTVRHVVDLCAGPDRMRAMAQAQAESAVILAEGRDKVHEIEMRAVERLRKRETRRQRNIEAITLQALKALPPPEQISDKPVSEDWTSRFFEECQDISDDQMQQLWARIMAGEVARPGSFAPRTLSVVHDLTKDDANLFAKLCAFTWYIPGAAFVPVIETIQAPEVQKAGLDFVGLTHLAALGLIEFDAVAGYKLRDPMAEIKVAYCGAPHTLKSADGQNRKFGLGHVMFSAVGEELFPMSQAQGTDEIRNEALEAWKRPGWVTEREGETEVTP